MSHSAAILPSARGVGTASSWIAEDVEAESELGRIMGVWTCPSITSGCTNLQEGVEQSAQPGNIFTSAQLWMQWERGGGEAAF